MELIGGSESASVDTAPAWFRDAIAVAPAVGAVESDGASIAYRAWGASRSDTHDLLLVHGGAAHARWWDHLAPLLALDRRVVAVDLAGHGDSGHRNAYTFESWADDLEAVITASGITAPPVIAGHSLGGLITAVLARRGTSTLAGAVIIDSPIVAEGPGSRAEAESPSFGSARVYPTREDAVSRFRPVPRQSMLPYVARYIAEASVREVDGGWSWKFDPSFVALMGSAPRTLDGLPCPVVFVAGEHGINTVEARRALDASPDVAIVEIPDAGHAMMLDQPIALLTALRGVLAGWDSAA